MEYIRKEVLTDTKWRLQKCCCCSLKTGTTIIGVLDIIFTSLLIVFPGVETDEEAAKDEDSVVKTIQGKTTTSWIVLSIIRAMCMALAGAMVYGNIKSNTKLMIPYVYVAFIVLSIGILFSSTAALSYIFLGEFLQGFYIIAADLLLQSTISLFFWHVVRCRTLEIDELEQPGVTYTQQDPELPTYGDVQSTYGDGQGAYGGGQGAYGGGQGAYGGGQGGYGGVQGAYGGVQGAYGGGPGVYGGGQGAYGDSQGGYGDVQSIYEKPAQQPPIYTNDRIN